MAWSVRRCSTIPDQFHRPVNIITVSRQEFALVPGSPFQFCPRYNHVSEIPMVQVKVDGSSGEHRSTKSPGIHLFSAQDAKDSRSWLPPTPSSKGEGLARRAFATHDPPDHVTVELYAAHGERLRGGLCSHLSRGNATRGRACTASIHFPAPRFHSSTRKRWHCREIHACRCRPGTRRRQRRENPFLGRFRRHSVREAVATRHGFSQRQFLDPEAGHWAGGWHLDGRTVGQQRAACPSGRCCDPRAQRFRVDSKRLSVWAAAAVARCSGGTRRIAGAHP